MAGSGFRVPVTDVVPPCDDFVHRYYKCRWVQGCEQPFVKKWLGITDKIKVSALGREYSPPCLWGRGILPYNHSHEPIIDEYDRPHLGTSLLVGSPSSHEPWHLSTDGAGSSYKGCKALHRVGSGGIGAQFSEQGQLLSAALFWGPVPSCWPSGQTVPRAEAWAPLGLLEALHQLQTP